MAALAGAGRVTCWLWNLLTGDVELVKSAACYLLALAPSPDLFLDDPMWHAPLPLDRYVA